MWYINAGSWLILVQHCFCCYYLGKCNWFGHGLYVGTMWALSRSKMSQKDNWADIEVMNLHMSPCLLLLYLNWIIYVSVKWSAEKHLQSALFRYLQQNPTRVVTFDFILFIFLYNIPWESKQGRKTEWEGEREMMREETDTGRERESVRKRE